MKRKIAFILALVMVASMVTVVFAARCTSSNGQHSWRKIYTEPGYTKTKLHKEWMQGGCSSFPHSHYHGRTEYYGKVHYECSTCHETDVREEVVKTGSWLCLR